MHSFNSGHLTLNQAMSVLNKNKDFEAQRFQFWLRFDLLQPYIEVAQKQVIKEQVDAKAVLAQADYFSRFARFVRRHEKRKALLRRLKPIFEEIQQ